MKPQQAIELARTRQEIDSQPGENETFEAASPEQKFAELGRRFWHVSRELQPDNMGFARRFHHTFRSEDGIEASLAIKASYTEGEEKGSADPDGAISIRATWSEIRDARYSLGKVAIYLNEESLLISTVQNTDDATFSRLEESIAAAESVYAEQQAAAITL